MTSKTFPLCGMVLVIAAGVPSASAVVPSTCLAPDLTISVWGVGGGEYAWSVDAAHACAGLASGTIEIEFEAGPKATDACSDLVRCETHAGGFAALGNCFTVEARTFGSNPVTGAACVE